MDDKEIQFMDDKTGTNGFFIAVTVAMCAIFGGLQWLFLQQVEIPGMFEAWVVRSALMLSVVLTGVMIYLKFGRANTRMQNAALWVGLVIEMIIMGFTFVVVVHPEVLTGTDIEDFAKFVSGLNAITTVCALVVYFALDTEAHNAHMMTQERRKRIHQMQLKALESQRIDEIVTASVQKKVEQELARDLGLLPHEMTKLSRNGANANHDAAPLPKA